MSILIIALLVLIFVGLFVWLIDVAKVPDPLNTIAKVAIILVGALVIAQKAGLL